MQEVCDTSSALIVSDEMLEADKGPLAALRSRCARSIGGEMWGNRVFVVHISIEFFVGYCVKSNYGLWL